MILFFRLLFGGTIPHYYYQLLEWAVPRRASLALLKKVLIQQLIYTPLYQLFSLYTLTRLEVSYFLVVTPFFLLKLFNFQFLTGQVSS